MTDTPSSPDVSDQEAITVADTPLDLANPALLTTAGPVAYFSVGSLGFGGQTGTQSLAVSDIGESALTLSSSTIVSPSSAFTISQIACTNGATSLPATLPVGGACNFTISYTAPSSGTPTGALTFNDNAPLSNFASTPQGNSVYTQTLALSGTGASAPPSPPPTSAPVAVNEPITVTDTPSSPDVSDQEAITVTDTPLDLANPALLTTAGPVAYFSVGSLGFGSVTAGTTGTQSLTVSDIGESPLTLSSSTIVSLSSAFTISQIACTNGATSLPTTLPVGGACVFTISYTAPSSGTPTGALTFNDNAPLSNFASTPQGNSVYTQTLALSGTGASAPPSPPPTSAPVAVNGPITVTDTPSSPDVYYQEAITVTDTPLDLANPALLTTAGPVAYFSVGSLGFGSVKAGTTGTQPLTVSDISDHR